MPVKRFCGFREMEESAFSDSEPHPREVRVVTRGHLAVAVTSKPCEPLNVETVRDTQESLRAQRLADELDEIALQCSRLPVIDSSAPDEILGYGSGVTQPRRPPPPKRRRSEIPVKRGETGQPLSSLSNEDIQRILDEEESASDECD